MYAHLSFHGIWSNRWIFSTLNCLLRKKTQTLSFKNSLSPLLSFSVIVSNPSLAWGTQMWLGKSCQLEAELICISTSGLQIATEEISRTRSVAEEIGRTGMHRTSRTPELQPFIFVLFLCVTYWPFIVAVHPQLWDSRLEHSSSLSPFHLVAFLLVCNIRTLLSSSATAQLQKTGIPFVLSPRYAYSLVAKCSPALNHCLDLSCLSCYLCKVNSITVHCICLKDRVNNPFPEVYCSYLKPEVCFGLQVLILVGTLLGHCIGRDCKFRRCILWQSGTPKLSCGDRKWLYAEVSLGVFRLNGKWIWLQVL